MLILCKIWIRNVLKRLQDFQVFDSVFWRNPDRDRLNNGDWLFVCPGDISGVGFVVHACPAGAHDPQISIRPNEKVVKCNPAEGLALAVNPSDTNYRSVTGDNWL